MKLSLCNEVLREWPFTKQCEFAASLGYQGLEIAPFTLFRDTAELGLSLAERVRSQTRAQGLTISSLHWLLVQPEGLSMVSPDRAVQQRTLDWITRLIEFAHTCGAEVLVHGSPAQRNPVAGQDVREATVQLEGMLGRIAPLARDAGVTYCLEPLSRKETSVVNTVAEAAAIVGRIGSPHLRTMLDASAAAQSEVAPIADVLDRHLASGDIAHIQVNDANRRGPGQGDTDLLPLMQVLRRHHYAGWIAVEPFVYKPDGPATASFSAGYMLALERAAS